MAATLTSDSGAGAASTYACQRLAEQLKYGNMDPV